MLVRAALLLLVIVGASSLAVPAAAVHAAPSIKYVSLGDSNAYIEGGFADKYADVLREELGVPVKHTRLAVPGWRSADLRLALESNSSFRSAVGGADVVLWQIGLNDVAIPRAAVVNGICGGVDNEECMRAALTEFEANWTAILDEIASLTQGRTVTLRTADSYRPFVDFDALNGTLEQLEPYWAQESAIIHDTAAARGIAVADVYAAFNGADGLEDPMAKGYIAPDLIHMSDAGAALTASLLRDAGFEPFGVDADGDQVMDRYDNCPGVANADQANADDDRIDLSPYGRTYDDITWPNSDALGDACDDDADNDGLSNALEGSWPAAACPGATAPSSPTTRDTDGDLVVDGAECLLGTDPASRASVPPRAPAGDTDRDGLVDLVELYLGTDPRVADTDRDTVSDGIEVKGFNTDPKKADTDDDGCGDRREIASINNDRNVSVIDFAQVAQAAGPPSAPNYVLPFDLNRDNAINVLDVQFSAKQLGLC